MCRMNDIMVECMAEPATQVVLPAMPGRDRYLGGAFCPQTRRLFCVPGSAQQVMMIEDDKPVLIGPTLPGKFKWLRALTCPVTGHIFAMPSCADQVLVIEPKSLKVSTFGDLGSGRWRWHGAVYSPIDRCIYGIPCNAPQVLRIDPVTRRVAMIGPVMMAALKWYGGVLAANGCIYGIPNCAGQVLEIHPASGSVTLFAAVPRGQYLWHGGVVGPDQCIYGIPSHSGHVLKINPFDKTVKLIGDDIDPGAYRAKGRYKYGGAVVGSNGIIYGLPSDAERVLRIDPVSETTRLIGPAFQMHNKWQNGYLAPDHKIYGIPCNMDQVLQIDCEHDQVSTIPIDPLYSHGHDKWEGGVEDHLGQLWCVPQHSKVILKIRPGGLR